MFSFSKECLTGNHHRSKHAGVPLHRDFQGTQDRVGVGECEKYQDMPRRPFAGCHGSLHGNGRQLEDLSLLQVRTGPGCRDGKSCSQHHQDPRILSTWDNAWEAYLGPQAFSCRTPTRNSFPRGSLRCHQPWAKDAGPFSPLRTMAVQATQCHTVKTSKHMPTLQWEAGDWLWNGWMGGPGSSQWEDQITSAPSPLRRCPHPPAWLPHGWQFSTRVSEPVLTLAPSLRALSDHLGPSLHSNHQFRPGQNIKELRCRQADSSRKNSRPALRTSTL